MNQRQFQNMYNTAIQKIAVGFYILDNCGDRLGYDKDTIAGNKVQLCNILAEGAQMSLTTIYSDSCIMYSQLPADYIRELRASGLLESLIQEMQVISNENKQKLGYKSLDN